MNRHWAIPIIALQFASLVAFAADREGTGSATSPTVIQAPGSPGAAHNERVYEIPPGTRLRPLDFTLYCTDQDCAEDRNRRCANRGHGDATDHVFHLGTDGSGNCLITCSDGYLLLVVEDGCSTQGSNRLLSAGRAWPPRWREIWVAPEGEQCADAHDIASDGAICSTAAAHD